MPCRLKSIFSLFLRKFSSMAAKRPVIELADEGRDNLSWLVRGAAKRFADEGRDLVETSSGIAWMPPAESEQAERGRCKRVGR